MKRFLTYWAVLIAVSLVNVSVAENVPQHAVFNVFTYKADGTRLADGYGFFITADGTGIAPYTLFKGASRAEVIDHKGKSYAVTRILGANSSYDLVKFAIEGAKKLTGLSISTNPLAEGEELTLACYSTEKKSVPVVTKVEKETDYFDYKYYDISAANSDKYIGCPLISPAGNVMAIVQKNIQANATTACAIDARFVPSLTINALSALNADLKSIHIPKAIPTKESEALTFIYMYDPADKEGLRIANADFIAAFPECAEGYVNRGTFYANEGDWEACDSDFKIALEKAESDSSSLNVDGVHHAYGRLLYQKATDTLSAQTEELLVRALAEENAAYALRPLPLYQMQIGRILFAQKQYKEAFDAFDKVNKTDFASADSYFASAQALSMAGGDSLQVLEQLDSLVSRLSKPYNVQAAQYLYMRAMQAERCGQYKKAVFDLDEYEKAIGPSILTHKFYSIRSKMERKAHMYQQALDDIRSAQSRSQKPDYYFYQLEEASILLQVGMFDEAITVSQNLLEELPENPDCHRFIGLAYGEKGQKAKALEHLRKAKELGDESVESLIERYK